MKQPQRYRFAIITLLAISLIIPLSACFKIERVEQPTHVRAGEILETKLVLSSTGEGGGTNPLTSQIGIHLPNSWAVIEPVTYEGEFNGQLTYYPHTTNEIERIFSEEGYSWWVGITEPYQTTDPAHQITVTWHIQVSDKPGFYELDYGSDYDVDNPNHTPFDMHVRQNIPLTVTADYAGAWQPSTAPTGYVLAKHTTSLKIPLNLVDLGYASLDSFNLSADIPMGWSAKFMVNGIEANNTGLMSLYQTAPIELHLTIPPNPSYGNYTIPVIATSTNDPETSTTVVVPVVVFGTKGIASPETMGIEVVSYVGSLSNGIIIQDNYAYLINGHKLIIVDVSNPKSPTQVGETMIFASYLDNLYVEGDYAYIDEHIVDISNPAMPQEVSIYQVEDRDDIALKFVKDGYAYYEVASEELHIVNLSQPTVPIMVKSLAIKESIVSIEFHQNNILVVASKNSITFIDVKNPETASKIAFHERDDIKDVAVVGNFAYLARGDKGVQILDISNPQTLIEVNTNDAWQANIIGAYKQQVYLEKDKQVKILDISNPAAPIEFLAFDINDNDILSYQSDLSVSKNYLYLTTEDGFITVDTQDPTTPIIGEFIGSSRYISVDQDIDYADGYLYIAASGLSVVDVSNPQAPERVGYLPNLDHPLVITGSYAYARKDHKTVAIIDLSTPTNPVVIGSIDAPIHNSIEIVGNYLYTGSKIFDISDPVQPIELSQYNPEIEISSLAVSGNYLYILDNDGILQVVDISDPKTPRLVINYHTISKPFPVPTDMVIINNHLYIGHYLLVIIDISDPTNPVEVNAITGYNRGGYDIVAKNNYVYIAGGNGIFIYDVLDPITPVEVGYFKARNFSNFYSLSIDNNYIYTNDVGLFTLRYLEITNSYLPAIVK